MCVREKNTALVVRVSRFLKQLQYTLRRLRQYAFISKSGPNPFQEFHSRNVEFGLHCPGKLKVSFWKEVLYREGKWAPHTELLYRLLDFLQITRLSTDY